MRILLTGKNGQVGYELQRCLALLGDVVALGREELDLADPAAIRQTVQRVSPQLIINSAAYTAVDRAEQEPDLASKINAAAPAVLAEEASRLGAGLIHYSTDYVLDGGKTEPYTEEDVPNPLSVYGATKLAGDRAVLESGVPCLVLRTSWVYATRGRNFLLTILRLAAEREQLRVVNDQYGAPTWARAIAETTSLLIGRLASGPDPISRLRELTGLYHLTAAGETTWYEFAGAILAHPNASCWAGRPIVAHEVVPITTEEYPTPACRPRYSVLSTAKLASTFGTAMSDWRAQLRLALAGNGRGSNAA